MSFAELYKGHAYHDLIVEAEKQGIGIGVYRERERILQWIADHDSGRCCFESHDLVAFIKGENK